MRDRKRLGLASAGWLILVFGLILAACGSPPTPTSEPVATLRPTFTPVTPEQPTAEYTPTAYSADTAVPGSDTPTPGSGTEAAATPEPSALPAATVATGPMPKLSGTLFYPVFDTADQTYHIYRMDLTSGETERFIEQASQPAVTSDGERIAWRSWNPQQRGLLSRPMDGTDTWQMIEFAEAARPDWAADNQQFLFPSRQEPDRESRLYLFTGTGEEPFIELRTHGSPIVGRTPAFLPDGRIVYQGCAESLCGLYLIDGDGANPRQLTMFKDDTTPAVSPDGEKIAYMSMNSGYWQVNVVNTDGTGQRSLTDDWYWNGLPVWSPDGEHIIFVSTRDENWPDNFQLSENVDFRLWIMDADAGNQRPLNETTFRLDGVPAGVPQDQAWGWIEERLFWLP
jgi:Tol biopolymer transport system component